MCSVSIPSVMPAFAQMHVKGAMAVTPVEVTECRNGTDCHCWFLFCRP